MRRYEAEVSRDGRWWMIHVPAIDGLTQSERLPDAELMARELIAVTLDIPIDEIAVDVHVRSVGV